MDFFAVADFVVFLAGALAALALAGFASESAGFSVLRTGNANLWADLVGGGGGVCWCLVDGG